MRKVGSSREATWPIICRAGVDLLYRHGFEGMNLRELAKAAGFRGKGSLYNYFESKEDFLFIVMCDIMEEILRDLESNVSPVDGPLERIKAFVRFHIEWAYDRAEKRPLSATWKCGASRQRTASHTSLCANAMNGSSRTSSWPGVRAENFGSATFRLSCS